MPTMDAAHAFALDVSHVKDRAALADPIGRSEKIDVMAQREPGAAHGAAGL